MRALAVNDKHHLLQSTVASGGVRKPIGLFIVPGVDESFPFEQQCEGEIQSFAWFHIDDLAKVHAGTTSLTAGARGARAKFFQVGPLLQPDL